MTEGRGQSPNLRPDGRDLGPERNALGQPSGLLYRVGLSALAQPLLPKGVSPTLVCPPASEGSVRDSPQTEAGGRDAY